MSSLSIHRSVALAVLSLSASAFHAAAWAEGRVTTAFDANWRFQQADAKDAQVPTFNDAKWGALSVPHDWSIEGRHDQVAPTGRGGAYLPSGVAWYRKSFTLPDSEKGRRVRIEFDGVMANSEVYLNGKLLGKRPSGYQSFSYDLTPHLKFGKRATNVLAVKTDTSVQPASRWYTGAGIYRHVRLVSTEAVQFSDGGVFVSTPKAEAGAASVRVQADVLNAGSKASEFTVVTKILDPKGALVQTIEGKQKVEPGKHGEVMLAADVAGPQRWSIDAPHLYKAVTTIREGGKVMDEQETRFGIRDARFDAATGFWLNGVNLKIKGVCLHHDGGAAGAAVPLDVWRYRFTLLRELGVNAIRTAHNAVAPELLDLADEMGFLVMDETFDTWEKAKSSAEKGYNLLWKDWWETDTRTQVLRDRNHPSVILYSVGNEIHDDLNSPEGFRKYKQQQDLVRQLDPTRPVTMALFRPGSSGVYKNGFAQTMDIVGQNYREAELLAFQKQNPDAKIIGTETNHAQAAWPAMRDNPAFAGQFIWSGFDYLGEADWPNVSNWEYGLFDRTGQWKVLAWQRQSLWASKPMVKITRRQENGGVGPLVANWTPSDIDTYDDARIDVFSNAEEVELFLNGQSLGRQPRPANDGPRHWDATFAKGTIRAVARNKGQEVAVDEMKTADEPAKLALVTTRATLGIGFDDAAIVTVRVTDADGVVNPNGATSIALTISGPGEIAGIDNGNPANHDPYKANACKAWQGTCTAIVKAIGPGKITLKAASQGLGDAVLAIDAVK
jgi:beta-galactosidase